MLSQSLSKEYLRLGGRVVAVESFSFSVTPDPPPSVLSAGNQLVFTASRSANWSVTSGGTVAPGPGLSTTLTVANPIPNGLLSLTVTATEQGGTGSKSIIVPLMTPISISGAVTTLNPGGQAQYSASIPVTWELSPATAGTVSPASTAANALTVVTIFNNPPGSPAVVTLTARDARAATDSRFQNNTAIRNIGIQYTGGPPQVGGGFGYNPHNGSIAQTWFFSFSDPAGAQNINYVAIHFTTPGGQTNPNSCALYIFPQYGGFTYLYNDQFNAVVSGYAGSDAIIRNSQCLIDLKGLKLTASGTNLNVEIPVFGTLPFTSNRDVYVTVANNQNVSNPGGWYRVATNYSLYYVSPVTSLTVTPSTGYDRIQQFRTSAMVTYPGSQMYYMQMSTQDSQNNSCQLSYYSLYNWAYVYSNGIMDSSYVPNASYTMTTPLCCVPVSSVCVDSYLNNFDPAPYAFLTAQLNANPPIWATGRSMSSLIYYLVNGSFYAGSEKFVGYWLVP